MKLAINQCPTHGFWSVSVDNEWTGQRITPGKCCGRWSVVHSWNLTAREWEELAQAAEEAAAESGTP